MRPQSVPPVRGIGRAPADSHDEPGMETQTPYSPRLASLIQSPPVQPVPDRHGASPVAAALVLAAVAWIAPDCATAEPLVVCLGDSLTEGYGLAPESSYPALVQTRLRRQGWPDLEIVNAGISGSTSASGRARLEWQLRRKPDVLLVALGANDGLRGTDLDTTRANLAGIIDLALEHDILVLLAGMKLPPNYGPDYTEQFQSMFADLAREKSVAYLPFLLAGVAAQPELNLPDGIHPNAAGYEIVAETVAKSLVPLLRRSTGAAGESDSANTGDAG